MTRQKAIQEIIRNLGTSKRDATRIYDLERVRLCRKQKNVTPEKVLDVVADRYTDMPM